MEAKKHVFTTMEKKHFMDILKKFSAIIENKDTDGASLKHKNEAWAQLTAEFNASPLATSQASTKQLRRLWINIKQRQREALRKKRQHRLASDRRPSISDDFNNPDVPVVANAVTVGIDTTIDDSDTVNGDVKPQMETEVFFLMEPPGLSIQDNTLPSNQPSTLVQNPEPSILRTQSPPPSTTNRMGQHQKNCLIEREYRERSVRASKKHHIEVQILREQLREAIAKADLAELILKQRQGSQLLRASEKHHLEMQILREQFREAEAKAKADLAELILKQKEGQMGLHSL